MAHTAAGREPHPSLGRRRRPVHGVAIHPLGINRAAFAGRHVAADKAGGRQLVQRRVGEQIASQLVDGELVKGLVPVERADDPVAIGPHLAFVVQVQAVRVGIAGYVQPVPSYLFAESLGGQVAIDHLFESVRRRVAEERVDLGQCRRQSGERQGNAANQCFPVGFGRHRQPFAPQPIGDEGVNRIDDAEGLAVDGWQLRFHRRLERPMSFVRRTLFDPAADQRFLLGRQRLVRLRGRHDLAGIVRHHAAHQLARIRLSRHDRRLATVGRFQGFVPHIQPQSGFASPRPVTLETRVGHDRPNVPVEADRRLRLGRQIHGREEDGNGGQKGQPNGLGERPNANACPTICEDGVHRQVLAAAGFGLAHVLYSPDSNGANKWLSPVAIMGCRGRNVPSGHLRVCPL
jgi:hypothetical protein